MKNRFYLILLLLLLLSGCNQSAEITTETIQESISYTPSWTAGEQGIRYAEISFDDLKPSGMDMQQCWNGMGIDDQGRIYIGFTSVKKDKREDFPVFGYDPRTGDKVFLGTFLDITASANNAQEGENIPKGHTRMIFTDGMMYMGSQSFHDLKWLIDSLDTYRGSHLFAFNTVNNTWEDLSAPLPGGVFTEHEGIVSLNIIPEKHLLVGLAHPSSDIVLYDYQAKQLVEVVPGIPWELGNPLSREIIVTPNGHIYTYRGTEDPNYHEQEHNVWMYDFDSGEMKDTGYAMTNGFWIGQTETRDGSKIYVSTTNGQLYEFDVASETFTDLGYMLPEDQIAAGRRILFTYAITLTPDEKKIVIILSHLDNPAGTGELYMYDISTGEYSFIQKLPPGTYTSADLRDAENVYFSHFGTKSNPWIGRPRLFILNLAMMP